MCTVLVSTFHRKSGEILKNKASDVWELFVLVLKRQVVTVFADIWKKILWFIESIGLYGGQTRLRIPFWCSFSIHRWIEKNVLEPSSIRPNSSNIFLFISTIILSFLENYNSCLSILCWCVEFFRCGLLLAWSVISWNKP